MAVKNDLKKPVAENKAGFPIPEGNYKMILIGFAIVVLGFILMLPPYPKFSLQMTQPLQ